MNYEKKYKEALSRARHFSEHPLQEDSDSIVEYIFPELKESEDERMRNVAINACKYMVENFENSTKQYEDAITWLEKQKPITNKEDEEVRQYLIRTMKRCDINVPMVKKALAWLEKQGEQKSQRMISAEAKEAMYDKPAWSEDDEKIITGIINDIQKRLEDCHLEQLAEIYFKEIDWLKSLKVRI